MNRASQTAWHLSALSAEANRRPETDPVVALDGIGRQTILDQLDTLEDIFYRFLDYIESNGEDDFMDRVNRVREAVKAQNMPLGALHQLGRMVEGVQTLPRQMDTLMGSINSTIVRKASDSSHA